MTLLDKYKNDLVNKKPIAILLLVVAIIVGLGTVVGALGVIWEVGGKAYSKISEWSHASEKENQELDEEKRIYAQNMNIADKIFIEVLANLKKIDAYLVGSIPEQGETKFQLDNYNKWYSNFGIGELDRQIGNFYANLKNIDVWSITNRKGLEVLKSQGEDVKRMLGVYFCCKDYYEVRESDAVSQDTLKSFSATDVDSMHIASGATVDAIWRDTCFWKYLSAIKNTMGVRK